MADLSNVVEYDRLHAINIVHPVTGDDLGVTISVVSQDAKRVVDALRSLQAKVWDRLAKGEAIDHGDTVSDREREILIHSIDSWDWGEQSFHHISGAGVASMDDRVFLIDHPNAKWLRDQISNEVARLENFTQTSPKSVRRGSKKT